jgi:uncharacterized repeat protein (TIGR01451 family)
MKIKLTLALVLCAMMHLLGAECAKAQTAIQISYANDSTNAFCPAAPVTYGFFVQGLDTGYTSTDTFDIHIFFGDGYDTSITVSHVISWVGIFSGGCNHTYNTPGIYSPQYIITGVDGNADTLVQYNNVVISQACGNISGHAYEDTNGNCTQDSGEPSTPGMGVLLYYNSQIMQVSWTDVNGDYFFSAPAGYTYTLVAGGNYGFSATCPVAGSYTFTNLPSSNNDFGLTCNSGFDVRGGIQGWGFRPGLPGHVRACPMNLSCNAQSGQMQVTLDPLLSYVSATPVPASVNGNIITWNITNLSLYNMSPWFHIDVMTSLSANIGDTICNTVTVTPVAGDLNPSNNTSTYCIEVNNSWDPNMKQVSPKGVGINGSVAPNTTFDYTVDFQNTGNDTAYNIAIVDTLSSALDPASLEVTGFSHPMHMDLLPGNIMKFHFDNIMLADSNHNEPASHGYLSYRVKTKSGLSNGTQIDNTAYIYFDFNPAVVTNTTLNTIDVVLGVNEVNNEEVLSITPNPASDVVTFRFVGAKTNSEVQLVDMTGRTIAETILSSGETTMDVSSIPAGVYILNVKGMNGSVQQRMVVIH